MGIEYIIILLTMMKTHITDIVLIFAIISLFVYQIRHARQTYTNTKEAKDSCERMEKKSTKEEIPLSQRLVHTVRNSASINRKLDKIVWELDADRGWVYLFHNSGYDFLDQPFCKVTNTNESLTPGALSVMDLMKGIPIGSVACFIEYMLEGGEFRICDVEELKKTDRTAYLYFCNLGIKSTYAVMLYAPKTSETNGGYVNDGRQSKGEDPIGIVGIDYLKQKTELTNEQFNKKLHSSAMVIKGLLIEKQREEIEDHQ